MMRVQRAASTTELNTDSTRLTNAAPSVTQRRQESVPRDEERGEQVSEAGNGNLLLNLIRSSCAAITAELLDRRHHVTP